MQRSLVQTVWSQLGGWVQRWPNILAELDKYQKLLKVRKFSYKYIIVCYLMASSCVRGYWEKFLHWKSGQALDQAAQGGGGVTIPGGIQKMCRCGTSGHGLAGTGVLGWRLDLIILEVFSNINISMILCWRERWGVVNTSGNRSLRRRYPSRGATCPFSACGWVHAICQRNP